jgi:hypothetical protein
MKKAKAISPTPATEAITPASSAATPPDPFDTVILASFDERWRIITREKIGEPALSGHLASLGIDDLLVAIQTYLGELSARALKDERHARALYNVAMRASDDLWQICEQRPTLVRGAAASKPVFPCNWPVFKKDQQRVLEMVARLGVGTGAYQFANRRQVSKQLTKFDIARGCIARIHQHRADLWFRAVMEHVSASLAGREPATLTPESAWHRSILDLKPYCRATAPHWAGVLWQGILNDCTGRPDLHPMLRELGLYRKDHSKHGGQQKKVTPATEAANIRDGIKTRITQAVLQLAPKKAVDFSPTIPP